MIDYETIASACLLLFGNPPKQLVYDGPPKGIFSCRNLAARKYREEVEAYVVRRCIVTGRNFRPAVERNKVLRCMYAQLGRTR